MSTNYAPTLIENLQQNLFQLETQHVTVALPIFERILYIFSARSCLLIIVIDIFIIINILPVRISHLYIDSLIY